MKSKILLATILVSISITVESCRTNSDCNGDYCDGHTISKSGICKQLVNDGGNCLGNGDSNSCMSKRCICNTCGLQVTDGKNCTKHSDCKSGWCDGVITTECRGIRIGFKIPSPGKLFGDACRELVDATCKVSTANQLICRLKSLVGWDACEGFRDGCKKVEKYITKVTPKSLGIAYSGGGSIVTTTFASFRPAGMTYCVGGLKPFLTQTANVMQTKLQGGGGGSGIATCDAPGVDCKEDGEKGDGNGSKVNIAIVLLGTFLGLMILITSGLAGKIIRMKRAS